MDIVYWVFWALFTSVPLSWMCIYICVRRARRAWSRRPQSISGGVGPPSDALWNPWATVAWIFGRKHPSASGGSYGAFLSMARILIVFQVVGWPIIPVLVFWVGFGFKAT
jgi:hypothetical protein